MSKKIILNIFLVFLIIASVIALGWIWKEERAKNAQDAKRASELNQAASSAAIDETANNLSFYDKLIEKKDVNILVIGDSIGVGTGVKENENWVSQVVTRIQSEYESKVTLKNVSEEGLTDYAGFTISKTMKDSTDYDMIFLCFGSGESRDSLALYGEAMIRGIRERYPAGSIIWLMESNMDDDEEGKREVLFKLQERYRFFVSDVMTAMKDSGDDKNLYQDSGLPNKEGHKIYAETVLDTIATNIKYDFRDLIDNEDERASISEGADKFLKSTYVKAGKMHKTDNLSFRARGRAHTLIGIDMDYEVGDSAVLYVDGHEFPCDLARLSGGKKGRLYVPVTETVDIKKQIKITFNSEAAANRFHGFVINRVSNSE